MAKSKTKKNTALAERVKESGDRASWIELQFDQAADGLTLDKYREFGRNNT